MMKVPSVERIQGEVDRMVRFDTVATLKLFTDIDTVCPNMMGAIFRDGLRLEGTLKK